MLRAVLLFLVGLLVGACTQAAVAPPTHNVSAQELESETVALARLRADGRPKAYCSGVWVSESTILTAAHCVADEGEVVAYAVKDDIYASGEAGERADITLRPAKPYVTDEAHDLALLRALQPPYHGIARVRLDGVVAGARVSTMGHPIGLWWSYSSGDVAAVRALPGASLIYVQTTAPTSPGNSGCGLFDTQGFLIGLAHAGYPRGSNLALYIHGEYIDALLKAQGANL